MDSARQLAPDSGNSTVEDTNHPTQSRDTTDISDGGGRRLEKSASSVSINDASRIDNGTEVLVF